MFEPSFVADSMSLPIEVRKEASAWGTRSMLPLGQFVLDEKLILVISEAHNSLFSHFYLK